MTDTTTPKARTITLTGRPPVKIKEDEWPIIASAKGDSYRGNDDYGRHRQALGQGECDEYSLHVRQHADGRTLVYGVLSAAIAAWRQPAAGESHRGGVLLSPPADGTPGRWIWEGTIDEVPATIVMWPEIADAIRRVGEECGLPDAVIRECIADLPAEEL